MVKIILKIIFYKYLINKYSGLLIKLLQTMSQSEKGNLSQEDQEEVASSYSEGSQDNQNNQPQAQQKLLIQREQNDARCATYIFHNEDHTLGNVLRVVLSGHSDVQFAGYSLPHPSESKINFRLQTLNQDSNVVLNEGLKTVQSISKTIKSKFLEQLEKQGKKSKSK